MWIISFEGLKSLPNTIFFILGKCTKTMCDIYKINVALKDFTEPKRVTKEPTSALLFKNHCDLLFPTVKASLKRSRPVKDETLL